LIRTRVVNPCPEVTVDCNGFKRKQFIWNPSTPSVGYGEPLNSNTRFKACADFLKKRFIEKNKVAPDEIYHNGEEYIIPCTNLAVCEVNGVNHHDLDDQYRLEGEDLTQDGEDVPIFNQLHVRTDGKSFTYCKP
jgi:hypothetical protein